MLRMYLFVILFLMIFSCGCTFNSKGKIEKAIGNKIQKDCAKDQECSLNINEITWFDWDKMLVFREGLTSIDINVILGKEQLSEKKFSSSTVLVFFKNGERIYTEENFRELEDNTKEEIIFLDIDLLKGYGAFAKDSIFDVKRNSFSKGEFYSLECKNCNK